MKPPEALNSNKGFTLIEVVIVIAIAGLIFIIVFLAVSQAQASRRDTQRKSDMQRLVGAINKYSTNNDGNLPPEDDIETEMDNYLTNFNDPTGVSYSDVDAAPAQVGQYNYSLNSTCVSTGTGNKTFSVEYFLEKGGVVCLDG